jgi:hypothetical protein
MGADNILSHKVTSHKQNVKQRKYTFQLKAGTLSRLLHRLSVELRRIGGYVLPTL